ncbi:SPOR domain-containing protein [Ruegeria sp. HKCCA5491]|uniref:SPOR domain-containing protein n=1 Tax=Ruegeria sp. HKCCA5491 TaxID=2682986 RepID=UPI0014896C23
MNRATQTRAKPRALAVLAVFSATLAGCDETLSPDNASSEAATESLQDDNKVELFPDATGNPRDDVEAPEVFEVTEAGLWDGRPSLGGVWVAHPDVTQPERVRIKNASNNKTVTGALFRRERNLPGPALQLSSAAAAELGILAGSPTKVQVVALRRKPAEPPKPEPEDTPTDAGEDAPAPQDDDTQSASVDTAEDGAEKPAKRKWWQKKETAAVAAGAAGAAAVAADAATDTATEAAEETIEAAAEAAPTATLSDPEVTPPSDQPAKRKWWQKKPADEITETPLDPIAGAAAAIDASEPTPASAASQPEQSSGPLSKPYVQVGTFGVEANAKSAADKIRRNGLPAEVRELATDDDSVWRVLVGPASTRGERTALQSDVKDLGFSDAFLVKN